MNEPRQEGIGKEVRKEPGKEPKKKKKAAQQVLLLSSVHQAGCGKCDTLELTSHN